MVETISESKTGGSRASNRDSKIERLSEIKGNDFSRAKTGMEEFDRVVGGGIVPGSLILIGGDPGIGKSTLVLQVADKLLKDRASVLYSSGEESAYQLKLRADRLGIESKSLLVFPETNIETIIGQVESEKPNFLIIDSIQTMWSEDLTGAPGSIGQVSLSTSKLMDFAKKNHIATFIIGHVTKEGNIAGPKILEHLVDTVLYLEGDKMADFRILRCVKNRFGSTNETGVFEMGDKGLTEVKNPSAILLSEKTNASGSAVFATMEGTRPLLVEVQALTNQTNFGYPKRTASGFDLNRLQVLTAVLSKRAGLNLLNQDIYVNIVGGIKIKEPALDLAVCLAIASSYKNKPLPKNICVFGEVGLAGEIRAVHNIKERLKEAKKLGFNNCIIPKTNEKFDIKAKTVNNLKEAIEAVLG